MPGSSTGPTSTRRWARGTGLATIKKVKGRLGEIFGALGGHTIWPPLPLPPLPWVFLGFEAQGKAIKSEGRPSRLAGRWMLCEQMQVGG